MAGNPRLIKVGRQGIRVRGARIPASFFRHQQSGKRFVVLAEGVGRLMHVRSTDTDAIRLCYGRYLEEKEKRRPGTRSRGRRVARR